MQTFLASRTKLHKIGHLLKTIVVYSYRAGCTQQAAALAFTSLLSLVPLMTLGFGIFSAFPQYQKLSLHIQSFIFKNFVPGTGSVIQAYLDQAVTKAVSLSTVSLGVLFISTLAIMFLLAQILNAIWQVPTRRGWIWVFVIYWVALILSAVILKLGLVVNSYSPSILASIHYFFGFIPFLLSLFAFTLLYIIVPDCYVAFKNAFWGALIAAILFECAKYIFLIYLNFSIYNVLYGSIAIIPTFLLWIYLSWLIILYGAVVSYVLTREGEHHENKLLFVKKIK